VISLDTSREADVDRAFRLLGDRNRLRMLCILARGPLNVSEICTILELRQPNVSQHLKKLLDAGVVSRQGRAGWVYYSLNSADSFVVDLSGFVGRWKDRLSSSGYERDMRRLATCYEERGRKSQEFFDRSASEWSELERLMPDPESYVSDILRVLPKDGTIAELGCGTGKLLRELAAISASVIGVDNSEGMLARARDSTHGDIFSDRIELRLGRAEHLPLADNSADAVVAHMVLHHLPEPIEAIRESHRVLREGGRIVIVDLSAHDELSLREVHGDLWPGFQVEQLESWLSSAGFSIVKMIEVSGGAAFLVCGTRSGTGRKS
jgi:ArsR family transcriptional regulator